MLDTNNYGISSLKSQIKLLIYTLYNKFWYWTVVHGGVCVKLLVITHDQPILKSLNQWTTWNVHDAYVFCFPNFPITESIHYFIFAIFGPTAM